MFLKAFFGSKSADDNEHEKLSSTQRVNSQILFVIFQMRNNVLNEFSKPDSRIRLLLATEAYSMGTDSPDIRRVIHAGAPTSMES